MNGGMNVPDSYVIHTLLVLLIILHSIILRIRNISDESCRENQNTNFMLHNFFFENGGVYEIMLKNAVQLGRP